jgi:hypothetical protein
MRRFLQMNAAVARFAALALRPLDGALYRVRSVIGTDLPIFVFLGFYLLTLVIGNVLYLTPFGVANARRLLPDFDVEHFDYFGSPGYWLLLGLPLVVVPLAAIAAKQALRPAIGDRLARSSFEISFPIYLVFSILFHAYCLRTLQEQSVLQLNLASANAISAVEMRYLIIK